jgi:hypothetical protein
LWEQLPRRPKIDNVPLKISCFSSVGWYARELKKAASVCMGLTAFEMGKLVPYSRALEGHLQKNCAKDE